MKPWMAGITSLTGMKHLLVGTVLFTVISQIAPALWAKGNIFQSHKTILKRNKHVEANSSRSEFMPIASTQRLFAIGPERTYIRWDSKGLDCILTHHSVPTTSLLPNFKALPDKYSKVVWPPVTREDCGVGSLMKPWSLDKAKGPWMLFMVKSAPHHFAYRNMVRTSWGSIASFYNKTIALIFLLGLPVAQNHTESWGRAIEEENQQFGDILQCPVEDVYRNLPSKVISALSWALRRNYTGTYYTITDDDCMMRMPNIYVFFDHLSPNERRDHIYCGFMYDREGKPIRETKNKWFISNEQYSKSRYPSFCHGGMYTMKRPIMKSIYCMSEITNISGFHLEDVLITGILRNKIGDGDANVKKVTTATGKTFDVMYYPWDGNPTRTLWKMSHKWSSWNRTLLQYYQRKLLKSKPLPTAVNKSLVAKLHSFWKAEWREIITNKAQQPFKFTDKNLTSGEK